MAIQIKITRSMWDGMAGPAFKEAKKHLARYFNVDDSDFRWSSGTRTVNVTGVPPEVMKALADAFSALSGVRGNMVAARTLRAVLAAAQDTSGEKAATSVENFSMLLMGYFARQEHQRLYREEDGVWRAYQCVGVNYHKRVKGEWGVIPPYITLTLAYREFGVVHSTSGHLREENCIKHTPIEGLREAGFYIETEELREAYLEEFERFTYFADRIGLQCWARGQATDDLDGNPQHDRRSWWWRTNVVTLDPQDEPSRVVIDLFSEENEPEDPYDYSSRRRRGSQVNLDYWTLKRSELGIDAKVEDDPEADDDEPLSRVEVPTHPMLAVFDLRRHLRLKLHVSQLEDYKFDVSLGARLILPADVRDLLSVLLTQKSMFADVIAGKGGGVVVLCAGPPGTGKTLTAEVYSEVMRRPLYAVQTAQLGTSAGELENELRRVFARAQRWGAILLLDEADVYVRQRGDDLEQNAIVGVFLRTLEYYQGVMFMTTNRVDNVDDAIASRCIARIDYKIPLAVDQAKIWRVLADTSEVVLSDEEIERIVEAFSDLSGRDIKNLLKLARMISIARKQPVTLETIEFVRRFKPTGPQSEYDDREGGALALEEAKRAPRRLG